MFRTRWSVPVVLGLLASGVAGIASPASGFSKVSHPNIVNAVPATNTPDVQDGAVLAITQVGSLMYIGGSFTSISPHGGSNGVPVSHIAAFDPSTGALRTGFSPNLNGTVESLAPGPAANQIYAGGDFTSANGTSTHIVLLDATTGATISTWKPSSQNGIVRKLVYVPNVDHTGTALLFAGGNFTSVGGASHGGLAALDPTTGKVQPYMGLSVSGHHNFGVNCTGTNCADGAIGLRDMDVDPSGTHLIAVGNFTSISGSSRDQVSLVDLGTTSATVDPNFQTQAYTAGCFINSFDGYMRGVTFSNDGSYFVIVATGGSGTNKDGTNSSCDTAARFETNSSGNNIRPTWIDYTGRDTLLSVEVTGGVVYVGGHERWMNNSFGTDYAAPGAIPRPGIAALNAVSGMPYSWNPGRNPRGAGTSAIYATALGLWIGSDTDYIGPFQYLHKKLAFFPLAGGEALPSQKIASLPGFVFTAGALSGGNLDRFTYRHFDGTAAGAEQSLSTGVAWSGIRGAFMIDGELVYSKPDGNFYERSFDGSALGTEVKLDPYDDPVWSNVNTGSGQTYRGNRANIASETTSITSLFFTNGRIYYTLSGQAAMRWRWFEPDSGTVGSDEFTVSDGKNWSTIAGAFLSNNTLYYADKTAGALFSVGWNGTQATGTAVSVNATQNWAARGLFLLADAAAPNQPPVADFTATCSTGSTACTFNPGQSHDPDGSITDYAWTFGQDPVEHRSNSTQFSHDFGQPGQYTVKLTVTDNDGATDSSTQTVSVSSQPKNIGFVGSNTYDKLGTAGTVTVPAGTAAGDTLLLFESHASTTISATPPAGWTQVRTTSTSNLTSTVYERSATAGDAGSNVTVTFSGSVKAEVVVADYSNVAASPIESVNSSTATSTSTHTTPQLSGLTNGSWVVTFWTDKSTTTTQWSPPAGVTKRADVYGAGGGAVSALLADTGGGVSGSYPSQTATTNASSGSAAQYAIALTPAP